MSFFTKIVNSSVKLLRTTYWTRYDRRTQAEVQAGKGARDKVSNALRICLRCILWKKISEERLHNEGKIQSLVQRQKQQNAEIDVRSK